MWQQHRVQRESIMSELHKPGASRKLCLEEEEADLLQYLFSKIIAIMGEQYYNKFGEPCKSRLGLNYFKWLRWHWQVGKLDNHRTSQPLSLLVFGVRSRQRVFWPKLTALELDVRLAILPCSSERSFAQFARHYHQSYWSTSWWPEPVIILKMHTGNNLPPAVWFLISLAYVCTPKNPSPIIV